MAANRIKGNKALAVILDVHPNTITRWRRQGRLDSAVVADTGRTIIYDLNKVLQSLKHRQA